jgi:hypothetical protein
MTPEESTKLVNKAVELAHLLHFQQSHQTVKFAADPELEPYEPIRDETGAQADTVEKLKQDAESRIAAQGLRAILCPALKSSSHDLSEIAKTVAAALLPLSLAHVVSLPITPLVYAAIALVIFNAGVSSFCSQRSAGDADS